MKRTRNAEQDSMTELRRGARVGGWREGVRRARSARQRAARRAGDQITGGAGAMTGAGEVEVMRGAGGAGARRGEVTARTGLKGSADMRSMSARRGSTTSTRRGAGAGGR